MSAYCRKETSALRWPEADMLGSVASWRPAHPMPVRTVQGPWSSVDDQCSSTIRANSFMRASRTLVLLLMTLAAACQSPAPPPAVNDVLRYYLARPGVEPAGGNAVVVYLNRTDGRVKNGPGKAAGTPWNSIRLLVRVGTRLPASVPLRPDDHVIDEAEGFELLVPKHGASQRAVLRFEGPCGHRVLAARLSGDRPERRTYLAEMQMEGMYLQYLYGAETHADHHRFASWAYGWYAEQECPPSQQGPEAVSSPRSRIAGAH